MTLVTFIFPGTRLLFFSICRQVTVYIFGWENTWNKIDIRIKNCETMVYNAICVGKIDRNRRCVYFCENEIWRQLYDVITR